MGSRMTQRWWFTLSGSTNRCERCRSSAFLMLHEPSTVHRECRSRRSARYWRRDGRPDSAIITYWNHDLDGETHNCVCDGGCLLFRRFILDPGASSGDATTAEALRFHARLQLRITKCIKVTVDHSYQCRESWGHWRHNHWALGCVWIAVGSA